MTNTNKTSKTKAVLLACGIALAGILLHRLGGFLIRKLPIENYWYQRLLIQTVSALLSVGWLFLFRKQFVLREKGKPFRSYWIPVLCVLLYCVTVTLRQFFSQKGVLRPVPEIIAFCLTILLVGVSEELLHRGVILNILTAAFGTKTFAGAVISCFICGTLFGLIHFFNVFSGIALNAVIVQVIGATGAGWLLSAVYLRSRNIRLMILLHAFVDFGSMFVQGFFAGNGTVESAIGATAQIPGMNVLVIAFSAIIQLTFFGAVSLLLLRKSAMGYPEEPAAQ